MAIAHAQEEGDDGVASTRAYKALQRLGMAGRFAVVLHEEHLQSALRGRVRLQNLETCVSGEDTVVSTRDAAKYTHTGHSPNYSSTRATDIMDRTQRRSIRKDRTQDIGHIAQYKLQLNEETSGIRLKPVTLISSRVREQSNTTQEEAVERKVEGT